MDNKYIVYTQFTYYFNKRIIIHIIRIYAS